MTLSGYAKNSRQYTGKYKPQHPEKYVGDVENIIYRSSYEITFMRWCDSSPSVLEWGSEEIVIPYINPWDQKMHRYFVDFYIKILDRAGATKKYLIEVKPKRFTLPPHEPKRKTKQYYGELKDYGVNQAKWKAATDFAESVNSRFLVITEQDLGLNPRYYHK